jgi:hypothetical protein
MTLKIVYKVDLFSTNVANVAAVMESLWKPNVFAGLLDSSAKPTFS